MKAALLAALASVALIGPLAAQPPSPAPGRPAQTPAPDLLVREDATQKISPHVWAIPDFRTSLVPNVGIIRGTRGTLVIDTGLGDRNGEIILREVAKLGPPTPELYLVTTHVHPEHDLGANAFKGYRLIRSSDQEADIAAQGMTLANLFSRRSPRAAELLRGMTYRKADITFDKEHILDLGGVTARIMAMGRNHTLGDTAVWVERDRVLFSGDVTMATLPNPAQGSTYATWMESLEKFEALKPRHVIGAHAELGGPELIANYRTYLTTVKDRAKALEREGKSLAEATTAIQAEMRDRYPDVQRLAGAVRLVWGAP
jgi:glyoxylase-like metal-dependent hydrolase (beta-lactamase superfamily II)